MFNRKAREALYRTVGMTQQATGRQPVWATCCSGKTETFSLVPSGNQALKLSLKKKKKSWVNFNSQTTWQSGQRLATKGKASPKGWVIPLSLCGLYNLLCEGFFQMKQFSQFCTYSNININYNIPAQKMVGRAEGYFPPVKTSLCCVRVLGRSHQYSSPTETYR